MRDFMCLLMEGLITQLPAQLAGAAVLAAADAARRAWSRRTAVGEHSAQPGPGSKTDPAAQE